MLKIKKKWLMLSAFIYVYIPIFLFMLTWVKIYMATPFFIAFVVCIYRIGKKINEASKDKKDDVLEINIIFSICAVFFLLWIGYYAGWGRFVLQATDWRKHNALLKDLVTKSWPVYYENSTEHSMLTYYVAMYLVPAAFGKILNSFRVAEIAVYVWNCIGLVLVYFNLISYLKMKKTSAQAASLLIFPFFTIPLWISEYVLKYVTGFNNIGNWKWFFNEQGILLQYTHNFALLKWVFTQTIPVWLVVILLLELRNYIEYYVIMMLPLLIHATLAFIGIVVLAIGYVAEYFIRKNNYKEGLLKIFSIENISIAITEGSIFLLYLYGNVLVEKPKDMSFQLMPYNKDTWIIYFIFIIVNIIPYAVILWKSHKKDGIYYACMVTLVVLPLFKMGLWNDLMMRSSISALFVLMIYVFGYIKENMLNKGCKALEEFPVVLCIILLVIGLYYPFTEISDVVQNDDPKTLGEEYDLETLESYANRGADTSIDQKLNYYTYDIEDNVFYKYFAKKKSVFYNY